MHIYLKTVFAFLVALSLVWGLEGCQQEVSQKVDKETIKADNSDFSFQTKLKYAQGFSVVNHPLYKEVFVFHPLSGDTMMTYITTAAGTVLPDSILSKGKRVEVPIKSIACLSTTQVASLEALEFRDKLVGCSSPEYIWDKTLAQKIADGQVQEIGRGMNINTEKIVALKPDALMQSFMDKTDVDGNLSNLGIVLLYNNEWKEPNLLGRAEWIKFTALFLGRERMADSIFNAVEANYYAVKEVAAKAKKQPSVMYGYDYKGTWYLPQSETYVAQIFRDANVSFKDAGAGNGSTPTSFEKVYEMYHDAEYWLSNQTQVGTLEAFLSSNERYANFSAVKKRQVYTNNKRENARGGNDYWESGVNRPDILLKDVVKILHPELFPDYETVYWQHLK